MDNQKNTLTVKDNFLDYQPWKKMLKKLNRASVQYVCVPDEIRSPVDFYTADEIERIYDSCQEVLFSSSEDLTGNIDLYFSKFCSANFNDIKVGLMMYKKLWSYSVLALSEVMQITSETAYSHYLKIQAQSTYNILMTSEYNLYMKTRNTIQDKEENVSNSSCSERSTDQEVKSRDKNDLTTDNKTTQVQQAVHTSEVRATSSGVQTEPVPVDNINLTSNLKEEDDTCSHKTPNCSHTDKVEQNTILHNEQKNEAPALGLIFGFNLKNKLKNEETSVCAYSKRIQWDIPALYDIKSHTCPLDNTIARLQILDKTAGAFVNDYSDTGSLSATYYMCVKRYANIFFKALMKNLADIINTMNLFKSVIKAYLVQEKPKRKEKYNFYLRAINASGMIAKDIYYDIKTVSVFLNSGVAKSMLMSFENLDEIV